MITGELVSHGQGSTAIAGNRYTATFKVSEGSPYGMAGYGQGCGEIILPWRGAMLGRPRQPGAAYALSQCLLSLS